MSCLSKHLLECSCQAFLRSRQGFQFVQDVRSIPREERVNILMQERPFRYSAGLFSIVDFLVNSRLEMPKTGILKYATRNTQSRG